MRHWRVLVIVQTFKSDYTKTVGERQVSLLEGAVVGNGEAMYFRAPQLKLQDAIAVGAKARSHVLSRPCPCPFTITSRVSAPCPFTITSRVPASHELYKSSLHCRSSIKHKCQSFDLLTMRAHSFCQSNPESRISPSFSHLRTTARRTWTVS